MKRSPHRQHGFALLLTLVLLMIAAVTLSQVARQSAGEALHALDASEDLQRRWAVTSCRATLLPRAAGVLASAAQGPVDDKAGPLPVARRLPPGTEFRVMCELAGVPCELVFTDEQAKYNPTAIGFLEVDGKSLVNKRAMRTAISELSGAREDPERLGGGSVLLRPMLDLDEQEDKDGTAASSQDEPPLLYDGYGQLFDGVGPQYLMGQSGQPGAAANVTCWGDGRLNLYRAPTSVIKKVLVPVLGAQGCAEFLVARNEMPGLTSEDWLSTLVQVSPDRRALAQSLLVERSQTQGLWVVAHGRTRSWHTFSVREYTPEDKQQPASNHRATDAEDVSDESPPDPIQRYDFSW